LAREPGERKYHMTQVSPGRDSRNSEQPAKKAKAGKSKATAVATEQSGPVTKTAAPTTTKPACKGWTRERWRRHKERKRGHRSKNTTPATAPLTPTTDPVLAEHAAAIRQLGKRVVADVVEIGRRLSECKRICGHGNWLPWLNREFGWEETTAQRFMRVHALAQSKSGNLPDLPVSAIYLLAAPSTPEPARAEIIKRAKDGEPVSVADVKQTIDIAKGRKQPAKKKVRPKRERATIEVCTPNPDGSYSRRAATEEESAALMDASCRAIEQSGVGCGTSELLSNPIAAAWRGANAHERDVFVRHWAADVRQGLKEIEDADAAARPAEGNGDGAGAHWWRLPRKSVATPAGSNGGTTSPRSTATSTETSAETSATAALTRRERREIMREAFTRVGRLLVEVNPDVAREVRTLLWNYYDHADDLVGAIDRAMGIEEDSDADAAQASADMPPREARR
jgi:DUF3102 family protein